jgi:hypothetical protein
MTIVVVIFLFSLFEKNNGNKFKTLCFVFWNEFTTLKEENINMYIIEEKLNVNSFFFNFKKL